MLEQVVEKQNAFGLLAAALADGEQSREAAPGGAVLRIGQNVGRAVGEDEPRADDELQLRMIGLALIIQLPDLRIELLGGRIGAHHARDAVAVRDADAGKAECRGLPHQVFRMRRAAQEREIGGDGELGISVRRIGLGRTISAFFFSLSGNATTLLMRTRRARTSAGVRIGRPFVEQPDPHALAAFDAEIVARQRAAGLVAPPFHRDALGAFGADDDVAHAAPGELRRRSVGEFGRRVDRLRPREQADRAGGGGGVVLSCDSSRRQSDPHPDRLGATTVDPRRGRVRSRDAAATAVTANSGICVSCGTCRITRRSPKRAPSRSIRCASSAS